MNNFFLLSFSNVRLSENENKSAEMGKIHRSGTRFLGACFESFKILPTFTPLLLFPNVYRGKIIRAGDGNNENVRARNNAPLFTLVIPPSKLVQHLAPP